MIGACVWLGLDEDVLVERLAPVIMIIINIMIGSCVWQCLSDDIPVEGLDLLLSSLLLFVNVSVTTSQWRG